MFNKLHMQTNHTHSRNRNPDWLHFEPTLINLESEESLFTSIDLPSFTIFYLEISNWRASRPPTVRVPRLTSGISEALTYWAREFTLWTSLDCGDEKNTKFDQSHNRSMKVKFVILQASHSSTTLHKPTWLSTTWIQVQSSDTNESGFAKPFASSSSHVSWLSNTNTAVYFSEMSWRHLNTMFSSPEYIMSTYEYVWNHTWIFMKAHAHSGSHSASKSCFWVLSLRPSPT